VVAPDRGVLVTADGVGKKSDLSLESCTIAGVRLSGIYVGSLNGAAFGSGSAAYRATIVSGFDTSFQDDISSGNPTGTFTSLGYNISSVATTHLGAEGDLASTDPKLGVLAYNGGQVPTIDTKPGSPAIGHIPRIAMTTTVDQRGFPRAPGLEFGDVGAIERVLGGDVDGNGSIDVQDVFYLINFLFANGPVPIGESDVNGDGTIDVNDVFYLVNRLFSGGPAPM